MIFHLLARGGCLGVSLVLAAGLLACSDPVTPATEPPRPVRTVLAEAHEVALVGAFPGDVQAASESPLSFRVGGKLIERLVQPGDRVVAGQLLARLDAEDLELAQTAAQAQLAAAESEFERARAEWQRFQRLRQSGFISAAEFDNRRAAFEGAEAAVSQARANLAAQRNQARYANLMADTDGIVTAVQAEAGQVVSAGQSIVRLADGNGREVAFQVPETLVDVVRQLPSAEVDLWSGPQAIPARVSEIAGRADPLTRTFAARVRLLDEPDGVELGMSATVRFQQPMAEPLVPLPLAALWQRDGRPHVWVLPSEGNTVTAQPVQVVTVTDTRALVAAAFEPGAEIVIAGVHHLRDQQLVRRLAPAQAPATVELDGALLPLMQPRGANGAPASARPPIPLPDAA